jgi:L-asparagine transporter-like permease
MVSLFLSPLVAIYLSGIYAFGNLLYNLNPKGDQPDFIKKVYDKNL